MIRPQVPRFSLSQSGLQGTVSQWMSPGEAVPFAFPWDRPLAAEPATAGMALGGFGNSLAVAADGSVPYWNVLPGARVAMPDRAAFGLNTVWFRERDPADTRLLIRDMSLLPQRFRDFRLRGPGFDFPTGADREACERALADLIADPGFYGRNREFLGPQARNLGDRALRSRRQGDIPAFNRSMLLDLFGDVFCEPCDFQGGLMAAETDHGGDPMQGYPPSEMEYAALFPNARTVFRSGSHRLGIVRTQFCPFLSGGQREAELPLILTHYNLSNPGSAAREFTILLLVRNLCGFGMVKDRAGKQDGGFSLIEVPGNQSSRKLRRPTAGGGGIRGIIHGRNGAGAAPCLDGELGFATGSHPGCGDSVTALPAFYREREGEMVSHAMATGRLPAQPFGSGRWRENLHTGWEFSTGALCVTGTLAPGEARTLPFALAMDFPRIGQADTIAMKGYVGYFPGSEDRTADLLIEALGKSQEWLEAAAAAQARLADGCAVPETPDAEEDARKVKTLALNSLSTLLESGTLDTAGNFHMRESLDYPWFNSLDVYFYAMPAMLRTFPGLHAGLVDRYADAILSENGRPTRYHRHAGTTRIPLPPNVAAAPRHPSGSPVHDLGGPFDFLPNAYYWRNPSEWNDLGPKFILMAHADYLHGRDVARARARMGAVAASLAWMRKSIPTGFHLPFANGVNDTFDNSPIHGISHYQASLWACSLAAAAALAKAAGLEAEAEAWDRAGAGARADLRKFLWVESVGRFLHQTRPLLESDLAPGGAESLLARLSAVGPIPGMPAGGPLPARCNEFILAPGLPPWLHGLRESADGFPDPGRGRLLAILDRAAPTEPDLRILKKAWLLHFAHECFRPEFRDAVFHESDTLFVDQGLADLIALRGGLPPLAPKEALGGALRQAFDRAEDPLRPRTGIPNCDPLDGPAPDSRQEGSCWTGLQFSAAAALAACGLEREALRLAAKVFDVGYLRANMPFALPESFTLARRPIVPDAGKAEGLALAWLRSEGYLTPEGYVARSLPAEYPAFRELAGSLPAPARLGENRLRALYAELDASRLKYIASRYTRNLMVHALFTNPPRRIHVQPEIDATLETFHRDNLRMQPALQALPSLDEQGG